MELIERKNDDAARERKEVSRLLAPGSSAALGALAARPSFAQLCLRGRPAPASFAVGGALLKGSGQRSWSSARRETAKMSEKSAES